MQNILRQDIFLETNVLRGFGGKRRVSLMPIRKFAKRLFTAIPHKAQKIPAAVTGLRG